ncbi:MAG: hypothetical protein JRI23_13130 [Deltaproteobacteria bacterium]|jgi:hypothetical protein|nr:hypothetical protein [Deltaproteobacteria bacterium]MBW2532666.1 hypothetical protein [Deltaproteobacteria bacterium]
MNLLLPQRRRSGRAGIRPARAGALRIALSAATLLLVALTGSATAVAQDEEPVEPVVLVGTIKGGQALLNPVWNEAKDPKSRRYTFRVPSTTVSPQAKILTAYLPKELCIVALGDGPAQAKKSPIPMTISGGRTTPVTLVVPQGQEIQIENHDPFPHRLYEVGKGETSLKASDIEPTKSRRWTPPKPGKYELRDELAPSLRAWVVVEPKAHQRAFVNFKQEFNMELLPGAYTLRGYFAGEAVGKPLPANVNPLPKQQRLPAPLVVGEVKKKKDKK